MAVQISDPKRLTRAETRAPQPFVAYCINLDRRPDRWAPMQAALEAGGLEAARLPAVDGADPAEAARLGRMQAKGPTGWIGPGALACSASHERAWERLLASGADWALVLEDDVDIAPSAGLVLRDLVPRLSDDPGLIKIDLNDADRDPLLCGKPCLTGGHGHELVPLYQMALGGAGYLIHRDAAARLLSRFGDCDVPVDHFLFYPLARRGGGNERFAILSPTLVAQDKRLTSDIDTQKRFHGAKWRRDLRRGLYEARQAPMMIMALLRGARLRKFRFDTGDDQP